MHLELTIDGEVKQKDITGNMLFKIDEQLNYMTQHGMNFIPGDLLMSGTPEGNSHVKPGDVLVASMWADSTKEKKLAEIK